MTPKDYSQMMGYLTRPAMARGGRIGFDNGSKGRFSKETKVGDLRAYLKNLPKGATINRQELIEKFNMKKGSGSATRVFQEFKDKDFNFVNLIKGVKKEGRKIELTSAQKKLPMLLFGKTEDELTATQRSNITSGKYDKNTMTPYRVRQKFNPFALKEYGKDWNELTEKEKERVREGKPPVDPNRIPVNKQKVNEELLQLADDPRIIDIFKNPDRDKTQLRKDLNIVREILGSTTNAPVRLTQLAAAFTGDDPVEGITPKFKKNAKKIYDELPFTDAQRDIDELKIGKSVGEKSIGLSKSDIRGSNIYRDASISRLADIDEALGVTSSARRLTTPYGIFGQVIGVEKNKAKMSWDGRKSTLEKELQDAIATGDTIKINQAKNKFNKEATEFENKLNAQKLRGAKRIRLPRVSLDPPSKTIANYANFNDTYKKAFDNNFKTKKYSFIIPKDLRTIPELRNDVLNPKSPVYKQIINTLKQGFNEFDEKKLFQKINNAAPENIKKIMRKIPRLASLEDDFTGPGGFPLTASFDPNIGIKSIEEDTFAKRNPIITGSGLSAAGTAAVLKATGTPIRTALGKAFRGAGTRLGVLPFAAMQVKSNIDKGENIADAVVDPLVGLELSLPGVLKENLSKITTNPTAQRILNLGRFARFTTPVGAALGVAGLGVDAAKFSRDRIRELRAMSPEQRQELRSEGARQAFDPFMAAGGGIAKLAGVSSGPPPESGPNSQGLPGLLKRVKKL